MHSGVSNPGLEPGGFVPAASDVSVGTPLIGVAQTCEVVSRSILLQTCVSGCDAGQTFANGDVFLSDWLMHALYTFCSYDLNLGSCGSPVCKKKNHAKRRA